MLSKSDPDTNTKSKTDVKHVFEGKYCQEYMAENKKGDAGVPDGAVNCAVHAMSQT